MDAVNVTKESRRCVNCGRLLAANVKTKIICCGREYTVSRSLKTVNRAPDLVRTEWLSSARTACNDSCEHWSNEPGCNGGCSLSPGKPCDVWAHISRGRGCFADKPKFVSLDEFRELKRRDGLPKYRGNSVGGIGFLANNYMEHGGTEVWHRTLLPRLPNVNGFVCFEPKRARGDFKLLDCDCGIGLDDAVRLANAVDTLVVWGVGDKLKDVMDRVTRRPRVISVSHCDSRSHWTVETMSGQGPFSDVAVYICPSGIDTVPDYLRDSAVMIPNAADPERLKVTESRIDTRRKLKLPVDANVLLITSRISYEKRIDLPVGMMHHLNEIARSEGLRPFYLVVAGPTASWAGEYFDRLQKTNREWVRFTQAADPPGNLINAADAALSASEYEGYGLAMAEAVLARVPVIATRRGLLEYFPDLARIVPDGATSSAWAEIVAEDFANGSSQLMRVENAYRKLSVEHSVEKFVESWYRLLNETTE